jgi:predicted MPP superfamily phosphohydrolase
MKSPRWWRWKKQIKQWEHQADQAIFWTVGGMRFLADRLAGTFEVRRFDISIPHLPSALQGITITHLTDLHLGTTFTPERHLPPVIAACHQLNSDLICITGDWIDFSNEALEQAMPQLQTLRARLGVYGSLGNHDAYDNRWRLIQSLRRWLGDRLLINQTYDLPIAGAILRLIGLDYTGSYSRVLRNWNFLHPKPESSIDVSVAMAHHPNAFPFLAKQGVSLTLSGHTHGGQISLTSPPAPAIGLVNHRFRHLRGHYQKNSSHLYVNCGLGSSIPIRWNCPLEIVQFKLTAASP